MSEGRSESARRVVSVASTEARELDHPAVGTEHLLLGLLRDDGEAAAALHAAGATFTAARHRVAEAVTAPADGARTGVLSFTARAQRALDRAGRFARDDHRPEANPTHVLLGVLDVEGLGCQVLRGIGVDVGRLRDQLLNPEPAPADTATAATDEIDRPDGPGPMCPGCGADLIETLAVRRLPAQGPDDVVDVDIAYCGGCGIALGTASPAS